MTAAPLTRQARSRGLPGSRPAGVRLSGAQRHRQGVYGRAAQWATHDSPWEPRDFVQLSVALSVSGLALAVCWYVISGKANWHDQIPWMAGAAFSLVISGFGVARWLLAGMREVHAACYEVTEAICVQRLGMLPSAQRADFDEEDAVVNAQNTVSTSATVWFTGDGMTRIHRPDCPMVAGKAVAPIERADAEQAGLTDCGVCAA